MIASFDLRGVDAHRRVSVHWTTAGRELGRNDFRTTDGTWSLTADLASDAPLPAGEYVVEVRVGDIPETRTTFRIGGASSAGRRAGLSGPGVSTLTLTTEECIPDETGAVPEVPSFSGEVREVYLCLVYENVESGQRLEVRWRRTASGGQVMAATTFAPEGSGELSASFVHTPAIPPGDYRAEVVLDGRELARAPFNVSP